MANPWVAKYTKQITAMLLPSTGGEIAAWAKTRGVPISHVMRELVEDALPRKAKAWAREFGPLDEGMRTEFVELYTRQGGRQVDRRREYDDNRRGAGAESEGAAA